MQNGLSARDSSTYRRWLTAIAVLYCTLMVAVVARISWDASHQRAAPVETAQTQQNPTRGIEVLSYQR